MNASRREAVLNFVGLTLLAGCFLVSLGRIFGRWAQSDTAEGKVSVRFAHWQLESGIREAYDRLADEYMQRHPDVHVEQMPIPESVYANWLRTQLIGGTAPELIETGKGTTNEVLANYFEPLTPWLEQPNPYNADNDLAHIVWRSTFIDGLSHSYNDQLLQYYDVPNSLFTIRMFYNRTLWREVFGTETPPRSYEELVEDCQRANAYRTRAGEPILPVAGAQENAPYLIQSLFSSQTQRLFFSLARPGELYPLNEELALDFLAGKWSFDTPAVRDGLELARSAGRFLPAGFLQLGREDALFTFSQGRALMTVTGSWDAPSLRAQAPFEVGVFAIPLPTENDPRWGHNILGAVSEAGIASGLKFGVTKQASASRQAAAVDFLRFLTSRAANGKFSAHSGWLPSVVGVQVKETVRPFLPRTEGYPPGFTMGIAHAADDSGFGTEVTRVKDTHLYRLFDADGGAAAYTQAIAGEMRGAVIKDFETIQRDRLDAITRQDTSLAAYRALARNPVRAATDPAAENWSQRVSELDELQTQEEILAAKRRWELGRLNVSLGK